MKIVRFAYGNREFTGIKEGDRIFAPDVMGFFDVSDVEILAPVLPSKIVAVALNYREHAKEMGKPLPDEPLIFIKPSSALCNPYDVIKLPEMSERVDYEGELAVVIGKEAKNVSVEEAPQYVLGYTCFNDVTARDLQKKDTLFARAKGFDTFAPMGPWVETDIDPCDLRIVTRLNGEIVQDGRTSDMVFNVFELISFISRIMTLYPGDVVATGTPPGVGPLSSKDKVEVEIEGIGTLVNYVE